MMQGAESTPLTRCAEGVVHTFQREMLVDLVIRPFSVGGPLIGLKRFTASRALVGAGASAQRLARA